MICGRFFGRTRILFHPHDLRRQVCHSILKAYSNMANCIMSFLLAWLSVLILFMAYLGVQRLR